MSEAPTSLLDQPAVVMEQIQEAVAEDMPAVIEEQAEMQDSDLPELPTE
jgi:hypothetical protein